MTELDLRYGDQVKIAKMTGYSRQFISEYFTGKCGASDKAMKKIHDAAHELLKERVSLATIHKRGLPEAYQRYKEARPRYDIQNNLPHGARRKIAREVGVTGSHVIMVLEERRKDYHGIVKRAEMMAAIHLWKTRFCKGESQLDDP